MATPVVPSAVWLYTIKMSLFGQTILNTINVQTASGVTVSDYVGFAQTFLAFQASNASELPAKMIAATSVDLKYISLNLQPIYPNRYSAVDDPLTGGTGALAGPTLPPNVAATLTKQSINATRWGRGSFHLAGIPSAGQASGVWTDAQFALLGAVGLSILTGFKSAAATPAFNTVLWSPKVPTRVTPINSCYPQDTTRVERRRTVRVGI